MNTNHKFQKRLKTHVTQQTLPDKEQNNLLNASVNNSSMSTGQLNTMSSLTKITKTEDDLFKSERKGPNEKDIYDIENKLEFDTNGGDSSNYQRENFISNRDTSIQKKIIPDSYEVIRKEIELIEQDKIKEIEEQKEKEKAKLQKKNEVKKKVSGLNNNEIAVISFFVVLLIAIVAVLIIFFVTRG